MNRSSGTPKSETTASRTKRKKRKVPILMGCTLLLFTVLLIAAGTVPLFRPVSSLHHTVVVTIPKGAGASGAGDALQNHGVIRSSWAFLWYVRFRGESAHIKAGRYALSTDMSLAQIVQELKLGGRSTADNRIKITFPEGYTLQQTADLLADKNIVDSEEFMKYARSPAAFANLHSDFPLPEKSLEGYLFPDTYYFPVHSKPERIAESMIMNFNTRFARPYQQEIHDSSSGLHEIVTIASLIEREAKVPQDRARIAGVIKNRLRKSMKLEIDATVLYALGHHKDRVLFNDLKIDSPYNTYKVHGLPPGPIANPGLPSLLAALRPETNDYIYYVARPDGAHIFTRSAAEHEAAKKEVRSERMHSSVNGEGRPVE